MRGVHKAEAAHLCLLITLIVWSAPATAWQQGRDLLDGMPYLTLHCSRAKSHKCRLRFVARQCADLLPYADTTLSVVKGSGSITSKAFMTDYTKNLTQQVAPTYGNVQYTYDAIGDTQGKPAHLSIFPDFKAIMLWQCAVGWRVGLWTEPGMLCLQGKKTSLPKRMTLL